MPVRMKINPDGTRQHNLNIGGIKFPDSAQDHQDSTITEQSQKNTVFLHSSRRNLCPSTKQSQIIDSLRVTPDLPEEPPQKKLKKRYQP